MMNFADLQKKSTRQLVFTRKIQETFQSCVLISH